MRLRIGTAVGVLLGLMWFGITIAEEPKAEKPARQTILFLGDSITRAGGYVRNIAAELEKLGPSNSWTVVNHGRSSETLSGLSEKDHPGPRPCVLGRLDAELAEVKPAWVVACYGINDGIYHPFSEKRLKAYQDGVEAFIKKVQAAGAKVILMTAPPYGYTGPFPGGADEKAKEEVVEKASIAAEAEAAKDEMRYGYKRPFEYYDFVMARYAKWLLTLNGRKDVWVVDLRETMVPKVKETHGRDAIHPNGAGHAMMAEAFMKRWPVIQEEAKGK